MEDRGHLVAEYGECQETLGGLLASLTDAADGLPTDLISSCKG